MKTKNAKDSTFNPKMSEGQVVEVLCQKMGDRWFAFSLIDDEVFFGSMTPEELKEMTDVSAELKRQKNYRSKLNSKISGHS